MKPQLHHIAIYTVKFEWYISFFKEVFDMDIKRTVGVQPERKAWFYQGIQINEVTDEADRSDQYDHLAIVVDDIDEILRRAARYEYTLLPNGHNWFALPNQVKIELIENS